jgi:hypothetical protein
MTRPMLRRPTTGCRCGPATSGGPPGGYTYLPLGKLVPDRNAELAREEMATIRRVHLLGAQQRELPLRYLHLNSPLGLRRSSPWPAAALARGCHNRRGFTGGPATSVVPAGRDER